MTSAASVAGEKSASSPGGVYLRAGPGGARAARGVMWQASAKESCYYRLLRHDKNSCPGDPEHVCCTNVSAHQ